MGRIESRYVAYGWCQKPFLSFPTIISPKKKFRNVLKLFLKSQNLNSKNDLGYWAWGWSGSQSCSHFGFQQGCLSNVETHSTAWSISVKRWIFASKQWKWKIVEVLHYAIIMQLKSAGFIKPAHIPKMYSRSHVSWNIQHTTKGIALTHVLTLWHDTIHIPNYLWYVTA